MIKPDILKRFSRSINSIVSRPKEFVLKQLSELSAEEQAEPAFHLATAMLLGFGQDYYHNKEEVEQHLATARRLLDKAGRLRQTDPHLRFAYALHRVLEIELLIAEKREAWLAADRDMSRIVKASKGEEKEFFGSIHAAVRSLSLMSAANVNRRGKEQLVTSFTSAPNMGDFAGFALAYAHRQDHELTDALHVVEGLEVKHPKSIVAKELLGGLHGALGDKEKAIKYFEEAQKIAPTSVPVRIGLAIAHRKAGNVDRAREVIRAAIKDDLTGKYSKHTSNVLLSIEHA